MKRQQGTQMPNYGANVIDELFVRIRYMTDQNSITAAQRRFNTFMGTLKRMAQSATIVIAASFRPGQARLEAEQYVRTLTEIPQAEEAAIERAARRISDATGVAYDKVLKTAPLLISFRRSSEQTIAIMEKAAQMEAIGYGNMNSYAQLAASAMQNLEGGVQSVSEAMRVMNVIGAGIVKGVLPEPEKIPTAISDIIPFVSALGIDTQEFIGIIAAHSTSGNPIEKLGTNIRRGIAELIGPSRNFKKYIAEAYAVSEKEGDKALASAVQTHGLMMAGSAAVQAGSYESIETFQQAVADYGLVKVFEKLWNDIDRSSARLDELFPLQNAKEFFLHVAQATDVFKDIPDEIQKILEGSPGEDYITKEFEKGREAGVMTLSILRTQFYNTLGDFYTTIMRPLMDAFLSLPGLIRNMGIALIGLGALSGISTMTGGSGLGIFRTLSNMASGLNLLVAAGAGAGTARRDLADFFAVFAARARGGSGGILTFLTNMDMMLGRALAKAKALPKAMFGVQLATLTPGIDGMLSDVGKSRFAQRKAAFARGQVERIKSSVGPLTKYKWAEITWWADFALKHDAIVKRLTPGVQQYNKAMNGLIAQATTADPAMKRLAAAQIALGITGPTAAASTNSLSASIMGLNASLLTNPIVLIVAALVALMALVVYATKNFQRFYDSFSGKSQSAQRWLAVPMAILSVFALIGNAIIWVVRAIPSIGEAIAGVADSLGPLKILFFWLEAVIWLLDKFIQFINWANKAIDKMNPPNPDKIPESALDTGLLSNAGAANAASLLDQPLVANVPSVTAGQVDAAIARNITSTQNNNEFHIYEANDAAATAEAVRKELEGQNRDLVENTNSRQRI